MRADKKTDIFQTIKIEFYELRIYYGHPRKRFSPPTFFFSENQHNMVLGPGSTHPNPRSFFHILRASFALNPPLWSREKASLRLDVQNLCKKQKMTTAVSTSIISTTFFPKNELLRRNDQNKICNDGSIRVTLPQYRNSHLMQHQCNDFK